MKNEYVDYLIKNIREDTFFFECDRITLEKYDNTTSGKNEEYKYHLEVLPQPYFGNIDDPKVLILGKNPSYEDGKHNKEYLKNNDNTDATNFNESGNTSERYIENLKDVNFLKKESLDSNKYFVNCAWHWWHKKVFGENNKLKDIHENIGIINLCPYHSKRYSDIKANSFESREGALKNLLNKILPGVDLIIIVWGYSIWERFMGSDDKLSNLFKNKNVIVLNKLKKPAKNGSLYGQNIRSIDKIISEENDRYEGNSYKKLFNLFSKNS